MQHIYIIEGDIEQIEKQLNKAVDKFLIDSFEERDDLKRYIDEN